MNGFTPTNSATDAQGTAEVLPDGVTAADLESQDGLSGWQELKGRAVEVRRNSNVYRRGWVEDTMPDGNGLWLAAHGNASRELIWQGEGFTVHVIETQYSPRGSLLPGNNRDTGRVPSFVGLRQEPGRSK